MLTATWPVSTSLSAVYNPWHLFFSDNLVKKKIDGFARFRGNLKVQVLVNGSAFHRGMFYVSYLPLSQESKTAVCKFNDGVFTTVDAVGVGSPNGAAYQNFGPAGHQAFSGGGYRRLVPISQRQKITCYPASNTGGSLTLPYLFPHEYMPIDAAFNSTTTITTTTVDLGELRFDSIGNLTFLGDNAPDAVDITVMLSLEPGYELLGPTTYEQQSGSKLPPEPKANSWSDMIRNYGPTVARLMGFSNPPMCEHTPTFRKQNMANVANSQLSGQDETLALHPGVSLASLNESLGGSESDMLVSNIAQRESYLTHVFWKATGGTAAPLTVLLDAYVHPCISPTLLRAGGSASNYDQVFSLPIDWVSQPFRCWQGDIIFTFEIITTAFQKGRLLVSFDPSGSFWSSTSPVGRIYTKVLDISEETRFEFTVPYMATTPWLLTDHSDPYVRPTTGNYCHVMPSSPDATAETMVPYNPRTMNGMLQLQILNTLTNDLDATIVVGVKAAPNFKLAVPCAIDDRVSLQDQFFLQSGEAGSYIGEEVASIRDLCHRSSPCAYFRGKSDQLIMNKFPVTGVPRGVGYNGGDSQLRNNASLYGLGSVAPHSYYQWFSSGFACARSSHKVTIGSVGSPKTLGGATNDLVTVERGINKITVSVPAIAGEATYPSLKSPMAGCWINTVGAASTGNWMGMWSSIMGINNGASVIDSTGGSVYVPYQSVVKFQPSNIYYDFWRTVQNTGSGLLIGEPVYNAGDTKSANLLALASFFYPADSLNVLTTADSRNGGAFIAFTAAGADMAFGQFCNAPQWFRARRTNTFYRGSPESYNATVASKIETTMTSTTLLPL